MSRRLFTDREVRAVAIFLPLALAAVLCIVLARPADDSAKAAREAERRMEERIDPDSIRRTPFDPNTVSYDTLRAFGLSTYEAVSLLRYRASGKQFRIPEDVALCYGISDSLFRLMLPYIRIGDRFAYAPRPDAARHSRETGSRYASRRDTPQLAPVPFRIDTVSAAWLHAIGAFTLRQAEALIRWRNRSGLRNLDELRACYVVDDSTASALAPYILFPEPERTAAEVDFPVDLNRADSAALCRVYGIGARSAAAIVRYRARLGGFRSVTQLAEIPEITEQNFERILQQICCDSSDISKIDINFAPPEQLARHPYVTPRMLRKILKQRQLKGGWNTAEALIESHILTPDEARRLLPYLHFGQRSSGNEPQTTTLPTPRAEGDAPDDGTTAATDDAPHQENE